MKSLALGDDISDGTKVDGRAAASAVHTALASNPKATANLISAGLKHGSQNSSVKNSAFANAVSSIFSVSFTISR